MQLTLFTVYVSQLTQNTSCKLTHFGQETDKLASFVYIVMFKTFIHVRIQLKVDHEPGL